MCRARSGRIRLTELISGEVAEPPFADVGVQGVESVPKNHTGVVGSSIPAVCGSDVPPARSGCLESYVSNALHSGSRLLDEGTVRLTLSQDDHLITIPVQRLYAIDAGLKTGRVRESDHPL